MALSDHPVGKQRTPKRRGVAKKSHSWSDTQKIEAVQSYLLLGNLALSSRILGIPEITLRVWKASDWWQQAVEDIKNAERVQLTARLQKIQDKALAAVEDRLLNGDVIYDHKSQQMIRKQVNMRDAHKVAVDLMDKSALLEKTTAPKEQEQTDEQRMERLAKMFVEKVNAKKTTVDVEVVDVTPKE